MSRHRIGRPCGDRTPVPNAERNAPRRSSIDPARSYQRSVPFFEKIFGLLADETSIPPDEAGQATEIPAALRAGSVPASMGSRLASAVAWILRSSERRCLSKACR